MGPAVSDRISRVPTYSGYCSLDNRFAYGIITLYDVTFQILPLRSFIALLQSYNPVDAETLTVWAGAPSLATTDAITFVFFSCGY